MASLRRAPALDQARMARQLPRPEADLVSPAAGGPRQRRELARQRTSRVRCVALARVLDSARDRHRVQAGVVSPRAPRARALPPRQAANAQAPALWHRAPADAAVVRRATD